MYRMLQTTYMMLYQCTGCSMHCTQRTQWIHTIPLKVSLFTCLGMSSHKQYIRFYWLNSQFTQEIYRTSQCTTQYTQRPTQCIRPVQCTYIFFRSLDHLILNFPRFIAKLEPLLSLKFEIVWNRLRLFLLRYTYPSKDRQSFLKTLLV